MKSDRGFSLIVVLGVVLVLIAGMGWYQYDKKRQVELKQQAIREAYTKHLGEMKAVAGKWDDAFKLASSTSRIALAGPVGSLQSIKRETEALVITGCLTDARSYLVASMDKSIEGYMAFMQDHEQMAGGYFEESGENMKHFSEELKKCSDSIATPPPV